MRQSVACLTVGLIVAGCVDAEVCREPEAGETLARIAAPITLRKGLLRTRETVIGSLAADSVLDAFNAASGGGEAAGAPCAHLGSAPQRCVDLAITNAGGLRLESSCGARSEWREGAVVERDVDQLMPFANDVVAIEVTGRQLHEAFELGVTYLGQPGRFAWAGSFLHFAGAFVLFDCGGKPRLMDDQGRVQSEQPGGRVLGICTRRHGDEAGVNPDWELVDRDDEVTLRVGINSFLAGGGDAFRMWVQETADGQLIAQTMVEPASPGTDQQLLKTYLRKLSGGSSDEFDPIARTRPPLLPDGLCEVRLAAGDPRIPGLADESQCSSAGGDLICTFDPSSRMTFLRRSLCYP
jgi:hypothetical protein